MKRRKFIRLSAYSIPLINYFPAGTNSLNRFFSTGKIEKRSLGNTGEKLSIIGFGGIVVRNATPGEASYRVSQALEYGVNYFDIAPSYGDAEEKLGPALKPYRKDVFLACKTAERKKEGAKAELEQSLKNLKTDYFDLYQLHAVTSLDDVEVLFGPDGAMNVLLSAQKEGKIKYLGFSAHSVEAALALMDRFDFDTLLFPVNFATWYSGNFGPQVLDKAQKKNMGILALKAMAWRPWPENAIRENFNTWYQPLPEEEANLGLRFTLSHSVTSAIPPGDANLFELALKFATKISPLQKEEIDQIKQKAFNTKPIFQYPMKT